MEKRSAKAGGKRPAALKIATFNVNGVNGRLGVLLQWLEKAEPDIVCLQELKAPQHKFPVAELAAAGYAAAWQGQSRWNGVAILSRGSAPIVTRHKLPGDSSDDQSRYIEAAVSGILICCLYAPNGNPAPGPRFEYKLKWLDRLLAHTAGLLETGAPVVLAGDFNIIASYIDVYKPERWKDDALFQPEVRDVYRRLLGQGWMDSIRTLHPNEPMYTFWDYVRNAWGRDAGLRLDHLLLSPVLRSRLAEANVDQFVRGWEKASDHAPAWISLEN